jgi:hypothetical protein
LTKIAAHTELKVLGVGDMNNDGRLDLLTVEDHASGLPRIGVRDVATEELWALTQPTSGVAPQFVDLADLDQDQRLDVMFAQTGPNRIVCIEVPAMPTTGITTLLPIWSFPFPTAGFLYEFEPMIVSLDGANLQLVHADTDDGPAYRVRNAAGALLQTIVPGGDPSTIEFWNVDSDSKAEMVVRYETGVGESIDVFQWSATAAAPAGLVIIPELRMLSSNPARQQSTFGYSIPSASDVELVVHDVQGRVIRDLVRGRASAGSHEVRWSGDDNSGAAVSPGMYFIEFRAAGTRVGRKMVWMQ